ncbi:MAG: hypothetical protein RLZZ501_1500 [Pseudomonadota bacterium]
MEKEAIAQDGIAHNGKKAKGERSRLPRGERERLIVAEAARFFAEVGFEGQTRVLAQRLGVTQPLLYRYFPDKDALIARVCRDIAASEWDQRWSLILRDRARPLEARLVEIYRLYTRARASNDGIRLFLFAALRDEQLAIERLRRLHDLLFLPVCAEARAEAGRAEGPVGAGEIDIVAGLHGAVTCALLHRVTRQATDWAQFDQTIAAMVRIGVEALRGAAAAGG